jgi:YVTN family beta-propeller protein
MKIRVCGLLVIAALVSCFLASAQTLAQNAYVANFSANTVSVIDTATNMVTATISLPVGSVPVGLATSPDGRKIYVINPGNSTVSVIATATNAVTATIPLSPRQFRSPRRGCNSRRQQDLCCDRGLPPHVISSATDTVIATILVGGQPQGVAVTPDGRTVYVANTVDGNYVSAIDTATNTVTATISVGPTSESIAVSPDGGTVYVTKPGDGTVSVIATATNTVIATIRVVGRPFGVAVTPDGNTVYVASSYVSAVSAIATATNMVTTTIPFPLGSNPFGVAVTSDGSTVYVTNPGSATVSVIATATNAVIATIPLPADSEPVGIAIQPAKPAPKFAGTPGFSNCHGQSIAALARQFGGLNAAAAALGFSDVGVGAR